MSALELTIDELALDLQNPRFNGLSSQREALEKIVLQQNRKLFNLADDIATEGLSPAHRLLVRKGDEPGKYTVLDGNRRLAALRILVNPAVLDGMDGVSDVIRRQFRALAASFDRSVVEPIDARLVDDEEMARHWIEAIHTGENEGRGVVGWDGIMTANYRGKSASLKVLDLVKKQGKLTVEEATSLERFPITNLDRLLVTVDVRDKLGLVMDEGEIFTDLPLGEVIRGLKRVVLDLASKKVRVSDIHGKKERVKYVESLGRSLPDLAKRTGTLVPIHQLASGAGAAASGKATPAAVQRARAPRKALFPSDLRMYIDSPKIEEIHRELRKLALDSYPNAVAVLARVFIELTMDHHGKRNLPGWDINMSLKQKIERVASDLQSKGMHKRELQPFRRLASSQDSAISADRLHGIVHGSSELPKPKELRRDWNEVNHVFAEIWKATEPARRKR